MTSKINPDILTGQAQVAILIEIAARTVVCDPNTNGGQLDKQLWTEVVNKQTKKLYVCYGFSKVINLNVERAFWIKRGLKRQT